MVRAAAICVAAPLRGINRNIWLWLNACPGSRPLAVLQETTGSDRLIGWHRGAGHQLLTFAVSHWPVMLTVFLEEKLNLVTKSCCWLCPGERVALHYRTMQKVGAGP